MNHTILLLEAQDEIREILGERLNVQGCQVLQAQNISEAQSLMKDISVHP